MYIFGRKHNIHQRFLAKAYRGKPSFNQANIYIYYMHISYRPYEDVSKKTFIRS